MSEDLDSILNGDETETKVEAVEAPEIVEEVVEQPKATQPRDASGKFAPKGEAETGVSPAPESKEPVALDHPALLGERRRRQELERELEQLRSQPQRPVTPPQPAVAIDHDLMFTDPAAYHRAVREELKRELQQEAQGFSQQAAISARLDVSEMLAREKHADFDEKLGVFETMVKDNPSLYAQMQRHQNPAQFAYEKAAANMALEAVGSIDQLRAQIRAEVEAEFKAPKPSPTIPESLADVPASRAPAGGVQHAPPTLDAILSGKS